MTTHGERIETVWLAIESIGRGDVLPGRLVLWLDGTPRRLPWRLRRLVKRGLEVRFTPAGLGVHTKYWPFVDTQPLDSPLITSDDDIVYPPPWLAGLRSAHARHPDSVIAYRAHRIRMSTPDEFSPYTSWPPSDAAEPSYANFGTSVSGQLLPPGLLEALREEGTRFLEEAPTADDVWLHRCAVTAGYVTALVETRSLHWWFIPGSQTSGLNHVNVAGGANDRQLAATHTDVTRARIWSSLERR